jgi:hypothetical protein
LQHKYNFEDSNLREISDEQEDEQEEKNEQEEDEDQDDNSKEYLKDNRSQYKINKQTDVPFIISKFFVSNPKVCFKYFLQLFCQK